MTCQAYNELDNFLTMLQNHLLKNKRLEKSCKMMCKNRSIKWLVLHQLEKTQAICNHLCLPNLPLPSGRLHKLSNMVASWNQAATYMCSVRTAFCAWVHRHDTPKTRSLSNPYNDLYLDQFWITNIQSQYWSPSSCLRNCSITKKHSVLVPSYESPTPSHLAINSAVLFSTFNKISYADRRSPTIYL